MQIVWKGPRSLGTSLLTLNPEEPDRSKLESLHIEAALLWFVRDSERTSTIHEAYQHGPFSYIVMDQFSTNVTPALDSVREKRRWNDREPKLAGCNGEALTTSRKTPVLKEDQVCKVASHLLEAFVEMMDRHMVHGDVSPRNFLVDGDCAVSLSFPSPLLTFFV